MARSAWERLHSLLVKVKEFFKEKWKTMGLMVVVSLLLDVVTGVGGGMIGAHLIA